MNKNLSDFYSKIFLHIGAHRTGTSSLQKYLLELQKNALSNACDVVVPQVAGQRELIDHRNLVKSYFKQHARLEKKPWPIKILHRNRLQKIFAKYVDFISPKASTLIISEENFLGQAFYSEKPGVLYPDAERNLRAVRTLTGPNIEKIFLSIRPYPDFLLSYELMREAYFNRGIGLRKLPNLISGEILGWQNLLEVLRLIFPNTEIEVWPYGHFAIEKQVSRLTGFLPSKIREGSAEEVINVSASFEALKILNEKRLSGLRLGKKEVDDILKAVHGKKISKEDIFSDFELNRLSNIYSSEIQYIHKMSGVSIVESNR